jgi:hypothetical protein
LRSLAALLGARAFADETKRLVRFDALSFRFVP